MSFRLPLVFALTLALVAALGTGCFKRKTPDYVIDAYVNLLAELDECSPENALPKLEAFLQENSGYTIADTVSKKTAEQRDLKVKRQLAREMVEKGDWKAALAIIQEAERAYPDGKIACIFGDIYLMQAQKYLDQKKYRDALDVLSALKPDQLSSRQINEMRRLQFAANSVLREHERKKRRRKSEQRRADAENRAWRAWLVERDRHFANGECCCRTVNRSSGHHVYRWRKRSDCSIVGWRSGTEINPICSGSVNCRR